jgi:hypothetical protein
VEQISASWASASISASYAPFTQVEQVSASWASASISASYVPNLYPQTEQVSASWSSASISASYVPNLYPQTEQASASWASASLSASYAETASYLLNYSPTISASWASSSISASNANTASYTLGIPTIKSGQVGGPDCGGTPITASIIFAKPFANNNYSVVVTGESSRQWTIQNKDSGSFEINSNSNITFADRVLWLAITNGEFYS